jgi:hypothetical protein
MPGPSFFRRTYDSLRQRILGQEITVYPTYGYRDPRDPRVWIVPMRVWVHDNRDTPLVESTVERWAARHFAADLDRDLEPDERQRLESILTHFIADDKNNESVTFTFVDDPDRQVFAFSHPTTHNGIAEESFRVPAAFVERIQSVSMNVWLRIEAVTTDGNGRGEGLVRFLHPTGLSIVSDIDDTIKVTHVPAGKKTVLRNTFLKPFEEAPGMRERYQIMSDNAGPEADVCFHYVSGSPWQMYVPLSQFVLGDAGFPAGTFHMKNLRKNLLEAGALESLRTFVLGGDLSTLDQKVRQITHLVMHHPGRDFILVGDSGERDPEVYRAIQRLFPRQIRRILIRDVLNERLSGMERIADEGISVSLDTSELENEMLRLVNQATQDSPEIPAL